MLRSSRRRLAVGLVLLVLVGVGVVVFRGVGRWLVAADPLAPSDAIFVLDGGTPARELAAADLYRHGLAPRVVVSNARPPVPDDIRRRAGVGTPQEGSVAVLRHVGVPDEAIERLQQRVENTAQEVAAEFAYATRERFHRVVIVSSPYHLRRVRVIWNARYQRTLPALLHPTPYEPYDAAHWWRSRHGLEWSLHEVLGIVNFRLGSPVPTFAPDPDGTAAGGPARRD